MLAKGLCISRAEFKQLSSPRFFHGTYLSLALYKNKPGQHQFSFSVSKKVAKKAVVRNRLRRRGYSIISKVLKDIPAGYFVFTFKKSAEKSTFKDIEKDILALLGLSDTINTHI